MRKKTCLINYEEKAIPCNIEFKHMKSITFRLGRDAQSVKVSCPFFIDENFLEAKIKEVLPKLIKKADFQKPIQGDSVFIFGKEMNIPGFSSLSEEKKKRYFRSLLLPYCIDKVRLFETLMEITPPYSVAVRAMSSRYGVNNRRTHKVTFALSLIHFDPSIIDSVIVHELAHHFVFDHSKSFYSVVNRYFPSYNEKHKKLRNHIYQ